MIPLPLDEIAALGRLDIRAGAEEVRGVTIGSGAVQPGGLFVAIGRGRDFCQEALAAGAAAALMPDDEHGALAAIAHAVHARSSARVVAITGSNGKTSTKDILAALCQPV